MTKHRFIVQRWVIEGRLVLESPAHFGNGEADPLTDMPLLFDEASGKPLLTGTSIAGALRNYLREWELGFTKTEAKDSLAVKLFGGMRSDDEGEQSPLVVHDSLGRASGLELRDGVAIDIETRTAAEDKKFDLQLLSAGSKFDLRFELAFSQGADEQALRQALAVALNGLENGEITLGARKRRGFGQCRVADWKVWKYDLQSREGLLAWLASEREWQTPYRIEPKKGKAIAQLLDAKVDISDSRQLARLTATFALNGSLMIRSGFGEADEGPDMVHLHSRRKEKKDPAPIVPGTSWAGVLRHRALKIARTLSDASSHSLSFVDSLFGPSKIEKNGKGARASRVAIRESEIVDPAALVQTRIKIDRFTGGTLEGALFEEQPVVAKPETRLTLDLSLRDPREAELGLLLLLLKDLWTGDLPIGGESGIGRGRLKGRQATLITPDGKWDFEADGDERVLVTPVDKKDKLEEFVNAFSTAMKGGDTT